MTGIVRSLVPMLIGLLATLGALWGVDVYRARRCEAVGGTWDVARRVCAAADPAAFPGYLRGPGAYVLAIPVAVVIGFVLWRVYTFAGGARAGR